MENEGRYGKTGSMIMLALVGIVLMVSIIQAIQLSQMNKMISLAISSGQGNANVVAESGETYEQMMARMHPDQAKDASSSGQDNSAGQSMVGGC